MARKKRHFNRNSMKFSLTTIASVGASLFSNLGNTTLGPMGPLGELMFSSAEPKYKLQYFFRDMGCQFIGYDSYNRSWTLPRATLVIAGGQLIRKFMNKMARGAFRGLPISW